MTATPAPASKPKTWMNIVALVTGILGMAIIPVIFGHLGVSASNKGEADAKVAGVIGLILGYLSIVGWGLFVGLVVLAANNCVIDPATGVCEITFGS